MKPKIIQIMPDNKEYFARFEDENSTDGFFESKIVCFALVEYEDGSREVKPMDICADGTIDFIDSAPNFIEIVQ